MSYGMPNGTVIFYGEPGFPAWVYELGKRFNVEASTYRDHQETDRIEAGYARNPQRLNRGIDWRGSVAAMQKFAEYLFSIKGHLEQVIWENPNDGRRIGVAGGKDVTNTPYYDYDGGYNDHTDHVHTRQSEPIPIPGAALPVNQEKPMGWVGDPTWLEEVLRAELGDRLVVESGWADRGTGGFMGDIWGVMIHHTGNSRERVEVIRDGRPDLVGPLSQALITPDGKLYLIAVGPCNHAGVGSYPGLGTNNGNQRTIGFECAWPTIRPDGSYDEHERWPDAQIITMRDATAAVLKRLGYRGDRVIGHKTYAGAAQGKWDPGNLDIPWFQAEVNKAIDGVFKAPKPADPAPPPPVVVTPPPALPKPENPRADRVLLTEVWDQLRGPEGAGWAQLGGRSVVDFLVELERKIDALPTEIARGINEAMMAGLESVPLGQVDTGEVDSK